MQMNLLVRDGDKRLLNEIKGKVITSIDILEGNHGIVVYCKDNYYCKIKSNYKQQNNEGGFIERIYGDKSNLIGCVVKDVNHVKGVNSTGDKWEYIDLVSFNEVHDFNIGITIRFNMGRDELSVITSNAYNDLTDILTKYAKKNSKNIPLPLEFTDGVLKAKCYHNDYGIKFHVSVTPKEDNVKSKWNPNLKLSDIISSGYEWNLSIDKGDYNELTNSHFTPEKFIKLASKLRDYAAG